MSQNTPRSDMETPSSGRGHFLATYSILKAIGPDKELGKDILTQSGIDHGFSFLTQMVYMNQTEIVSDRNAPN
jgi:hypothetical protein